MLLDASDVTQLSDDGLYAAIVVSGTALHAYDVFEKTAHPDEFEVVALKALRAAQGRVRSVVIAEQNRRYVEKRIGVDISSDCG